MEVSPTQICESVLLLRHQKTTIRRFRPVFVVETLSLLNGFFRDIHPSAVDFSVLPFQMDCIQWHREQLFANSDEAAEGNRCILNFSIRPNHQILYFALLLIP